MTADNSRLREYVSAFSSRYSLPGDVTLFGSYVSTLINTGASQADMTRSLTAILRERAPEFVAGLSELVPLPNIDRPAPPAAPTQRPSRREPDPPPEDPVPRRFSERATRRRFIVYVAGLDDALCTVDRIFHEFHTFGTIRAVQVNRSEKFALLEFGDLRTAYRVVVARIPGFDYSRMRVGFATEVGEEEIRALDSEK
jgi:hypothetical protein